MHDSRPGVFTHAQSVSFFDEAAGAFYGATATSPAEAAAGGGQAAEEAAATAVSAAAAEAAPAPAGGARAAVDFGFDVFWHSRIADPRCIAVVSLCVWEAVCMAACAHTDFALSVMLSFGTAASQSLAASQW